MLILKMNKKTKEIKSIFSSAELKDFDYNLLALTDFLENKSKIGAKKHFVFNNLSAQIVYSDSSNLIFEIKKESMEDAQNYTLTRNIIHNLNNIISSINTNAYLIKDASNDKNVLDIAESIYDLSKTATALSRSYLKYSISKQVSSITEFDLKELIADVINILSFRLKRENIALIFKFDEFVPFYKGIKGYLQQVILAISLNAIESFENFKHKREKAIIIKLFYDPNEFYTIEIMDNACGIDPKNLGKIFNEGFSTKEKGNGLGLSFAKFIIEANDGEISINSKVAEGTIVNIKLFDRENSED